MRRPSVQCLIRSSSLVRAASGTGNRNGDHGGAIFTTVLFLLLSTSPAAAHMLGGPMGGFGSGFGHPLAGADHFLAMLAVGLWGAQMGGRTVWALPSTFPLIMCVGGVGGMLGLVPDPIITTAIAISVIVLGSAIALRWRAPDWAAVLIVAIFALFHGYPHGQMTLRASDPAAFTVGFVVSTGIIHIIGIGIGYGLSRIREGQLVRVLGGLIAASGVYFLIF